MKLEQLFELISLAKAIKRAQESIEGVVAVDGKNVHITVEEFKNLFGQGFVRTFGKTENLYQHDMCIDGICIMCLGDQEI